MQAITLRAGNLGLDVLPALGGAVTRFKSGDFPIFRETQSSPASVSDCASFPLIPFSNRIRAGRFSFGGVDYAIPTDRRDPRFANHGHTRHLPWEVVSQSATELVLRFIQAEPVPSWPFPFTAEQAFILSPGQLTMQARIRNDHSAAAPAGLGFHPYFTRLPDTMLGFTADAVWETDELDISVRSLAPAKKFDFSICKPIPAPLINHAYGGWNQIAEITHPSRLRIALTATGAFDHLILFTPEERDFFGFEPVSHRPDAVNPLADMGEKSMAVLAPGDILEASVTIAITPV